MTRRYAVGFLWCIVFFSHCKRYESDKLRTVTADGLEHQIDLTQLQTLGKKQKRGFIGLEVFGQGTRVQILGKDNKPLTLQTNDFPKTYRLFLRHDNRLQLVRFETESLAPIPGSQSLHDTGPRHRPRWQTELQEVTSIIFLR